MKNLHLYQVKGIDAIWHWWGDSPINTIGLLPFCICQINPDGNIIIRGSYSTSNKAFKDKKLIEWKLRKKFVDTIGSNHQFKVLFYNIKDEVRNIYATEKI